MWCLISCRCVWTCSNNYTTEYVTHWLSNIYPALLSSHSANRYLNTFVLELGGLGAFGVMKAIWSARISRMFTCQELLAFHCAWDVSIHQLEFRRNKGACNMERERPTCQKKMSCVGYIFVPINHLHRFKLLVRIQSLAKTFALPKYLLVENVSPCH